MVTSCFYLLPQHTHQVGKKQVVCVDKSGLNTVKVCFQPLKVISLTASLIRWCMQVYVD